MGVPWFAIAAPGRAHTAEIDSVPTGLFVPVQPEESTPGVQGYVHLV